MATGHREYNLREPEVSSFRCKACLLHFHDARIDFSHLIDASGSVVQAKRGCSMPQGKSDQDLVEVYQVAGALMAESIRLLLVSFGIDALTLQESAGRVYGVTTGPLGAVHILVPRSQESDARAILAAMERGDLELPDMPPDGHHDL